MDSVMLAEGAAYQAYLSNNTLTNAVKMTIGGDR